MYLIVLNFVFYIVLYKEILIIFDFRKNLYEISFYSL